VATVGDGCRTSFWLDTWVGGAPLGERWPVLLSHALDAGATVGAVLRAGVRRSLVPRLTSEGERQLPALMELVSGVVLTQTPDVRELVRCRRKDGALDASSLYRLRTWGGVDAPFYSFVWENHAPPRVRFFAWLLSRSRIPSRSSLLRKNILTAAEAGCPMCNAPLETANHIFFECAFAILFWSAVGFSYPGDADVRRLYDYGAPACVPTETAPTFMLLCLWNLWKHRNAAVFQGQRPCLPLLLKICRDETRLWRVRLPGDQELVMAAWLQCFAAP
jgi:hypothetical protein